MCRWSTRSAGVVCGMWCWMWCRVLAWVVWCGMLLVWWIVVFALLVVSVLASMRWLLYGAPKRDVTAMTVPEKNVQSYMNYSAEDLSPLQCLLVAKKICL